MAIKKSNEAVERYLRFYLLRRNDDFSEAEIASKLGFGAPQALYQQMRADKHPVCPTCGEFPVEEGHCETPATPRRQARKGGSEALQLPPAENAIKVIEDVLNDLLHRKRSHLKKREERLEGGRIIVERDYQKVSDGDYWWLWREDCTEEGWQRFCEEHGINPNLTAVPMPVRTHGEQYTLLRREDFPEEEWLRFCQERGEDSEVNMVEVPFTDTRLLEGASRIPPEPLYALIGVYILGGGSLEELLADLYPYPATIDRERLEKMVRRLKIENGRIATLVRGGNPRTGRGSEGLDAYEHTTAVYIQRRRREGMPDDQIRKELSYEAPALPEAPFPPESITQEELERLGGLNLT